MKRKLGQMIADDECHCVQFSKVADVFCSDCNGTGKIEKKRLKNEQNKEDQ